jgi:ferritin-like metal-binding protein YciE
MMTEARIGDRLTSYLRDAHAIEEQALAQLRGASEVAGDAQLGQAFREHLAETEAHEAAVRARLQARGAQPSGVKDVAMKVGGAGFLLFARSQPDTPGKLAAHAFSYEYFELAAYELLRRVADAAGDRETAAVAKAIAAEERRMGERLEAGFPAAVDASIRAVGRSDLQDQLRRYLADAHAIESQATQLLERGPKLAGDPELRRIYAEHLDETREHERLVDRALDTAGGQSSWLKDAAMAAGGINWSMFFGAQPDTPGKLTAFVYALEHLEIAGYEQLEQVAQLSGDAAVADTAAEILRQERAAAARISEGFDRAATASLAAVGAGG